MGGYHAMHLQASLAARAKCRDYLERLLTGRIDELSAAPCPETDIGRAVAFLRRPGAAHLTGATPPHAGGHAFLR
jgi:hypothetical protein